MSTAKIKVGEIYRAANGKTVRITEDLKAGLFRGDIGNDRSVIYRDSGDVFTAGWDAYSIEDHLRLISGIEHAVTSIEDITPADRLDALESQCRDIFRQLRNMRGLRGEMAEIAADMAAKVSELVERLDGTDRRVAAINEGLTDGGDVILKHEDQIKTLEEGLAKRWDAPNRVPAHDRIDDLYRGLAKHASAIATVNATLARIEDCLTAEKPRSIPNPMNVPVPKGFVANHPDLPACGNPACGQCYSPRKSLGWINVFTVTDQSSILARGGPRINGPFNTKAEAMACREDRPILRHAACVEIFEGDGL